MIYGVGALQSSYVKSKTFKEIKTLERIFEKTSLITSTDQKIAKNILRDLNLHWSKYGYFSKTKERMRDSLSPKPSIDTIKRTYKKLVKLGILVPIWFEKGGNVATRYVVMTKAIYNIDSKKSVNLVKGKLIRIDSKSKEFIFEEGSQKNQKTYGYSDEFIESIYDFLDCLTGAKSTTYLYERTPVSRMKILSYQFRVDGLISHYDYISYACSLVSGEEISMKDVYKIEMIENKYKNEIKANNRKSFIARMAEFNESISEPLPIEYEGGFAELRG